MHFFFERLRAFKLIFQRRWVRIFEIRLFQRPTDIDFTSHVVAYDPCMLRRVFFIFNDQSQQSGDLWSIRKCEYRHRRPLTYLLLIVSESSTLEVYTRTWIVAASAHFTAETSETISLKYYCYVTRTLVQHRHSNTQIISFIHSYLVLELARVKYWKRASRDSLLSNNWYFVIFRVCVNRVNCNCRNVISCCNNVCQS